MRTILTTIFVFSLVLTPILEGVVRGEVKNLSADQKITAKIKAFDKKFFKGFDVYSAGTQEAPTALLFDRKDQHHLPAQDWGGPLSEPTQDWGGPLSEKEIIDAIKRLSQQYKERSWYVPVQPRALNIVNSNGEVLGYVYTGVETIQTDLKKDGLVAVYPPFKNLSEDKGITAKIEAFDTDFFKGFDVYSAGTREAPTALLFDRKDQYHIPAPSWEKPLIGEEEIIFAIRRLDQQAKDRSSQIPLLPQALNVVNRKGGVLGYVYTGVKIILMDREQDGRVTVYRPGTEKLDGGGGAGGGGSGSGGTSAGP
jgi:hypothetical protein